MGRTRHVPSAPEQPANWLFSLGVRAGADQTRSHLVLPPPPTRVCPASAVSSFSACIPRGAECGKNEFPPGLRAPGRHGSFPDAACAAPKLPTSAALRVPPGRQRAGAGDMGLGVGAPQPSRTPAALGRAPARSGGIRLAGRIRARESSSPDSRANKKHQDLLAPPAPDVHPKKQFSAEMQQVAPGARPKPSLS